MRARLIAAFLAIAFAILVAQDIPLGSYLQTVERDRVMLSLERDAWALASAAEPLIATDKFEAMAVAAQRYSIQSLARVAIVDESATVLASTKAGELGYDYSNRPEIMAALSGQAVEGERNSELLGGSMLYVAVPIRSGEQIIGALRLTYPVSRVNAIVGEHLRSLFLAGVTTLLVALTAAVLLAGVFTRRLRRIHAATEQLAAGDLATRIDVVEGGAPELQGLEHSFNLMASRLQTLIESQQAFASDASHQLRTPLTALRLRLENAVEHVGSAEVTSQVIEAAVVEVQRLQVLVDGMLALTRLESQAVHIGEKDVSTIIAGRVELWSPLADERGITLRCTVPAGLRVHAAEGTLEHVLDSYLDNALEFAPDGSTISITAVSHDQSIDFHVIDAGPGMTEAHRARAFDRFWRGRADGNGSGLGLAIAARMAQVSGGTVRLEAAHPHGVDAVVTLHRATNAR